MRFAYEPVLYKKASKHACVRKAPALTGSFVGPAFAERGSVSSSGTSLRAERDMRRGNGMLDVGVIVKGTGTEIDYDQTCTRITPDGNVMAV